MVVLGVDPGTARTGYAIVKKEKGENQLLCFGVISTEKSLNSELRLLEVFNRLSKLIRKWQVTELALESLFFNANAKTAMLVSQASGVVKLLAARSRVPLFEYTPLQVKIALTGYGRAEKSQVGKMVQRIFNLEAVPSPDDAADAVAIALCHCYSRKLKVSFKK